MTWYDESDPSQPPWTSIMLPKDVQTIAKYNTKVTDCSRLLKQKSAIWVIWRLGQCDLEYFLYTFPGSLRFELLLSDLKGQFAPLSMILAIWASRFELANRIARFCDSSWADTNIYIYIYIYIVQNISLYLSISLSLSPSLSLPLYLTPSLSLSI
jgi:hypothetical protein